MASSAGPTVMRSLLNCVYILVLAVQPGIGDLDLATLEDDEIDLAKRNECVSSAGDCFNSEQCCAGLTCIAVTGRGDLPETPGQCVKSKELKACTTVEDCYLYPGFGGASVQCAPLRQSDTSGQRYCLRSTVVSHTIVSRRPLAQLNGPRKHQTISRMLSNFAGSCETDADCQTFATNNPGTRLCCQLVSQGRQGTRRLCDRVTAVSVCIPPSMK